MADNNILGGTWYFNDTLTDTTPINVSVNFICYVDNELWECTRLEYKDTGWLVFIKSDNAVLAYDSNSWTIRYITFKSKQTNETLLAWMQANATKLPSENIIFNSVEDYLSQIALLQDNMHNLIVSEGGAKPAYSIEQYMKALINTRESFAAFLNANGVTANLSEKISPAWVDKFKIALNNYIKGGSAMDIYNDELTSLSSGYYSMKTMRSLTCPNVTKIEDAACCGGMSFQNETTIGNASDGLSLEEINFDNCIEIINSSNWIVDYNYVSRVGAFAFRSKLKIVNMPKLEYLLTPAFYKCSSLESINLPSLKRLGDSSNTYVLGAFAYCNKLHTFEAPNLENIEGQSPFYKCPKLANVNLGKVPSITSSLFKGCTNLVNVIAPNVITIGGSSFRGCSLLTTFDFTNIESVGGEAFYNSGLTGKIELPICTKIYAAAFQNCKKLTEFEAPNLKEIATYLNSVNYYAFASCTLLNKVNLGFIKNIPYYTFQNCSVLTDVHLGAEQVVTLSSTTAFSSASATNPVTLHVRPSYADSYATATNWSSLISAGKIIIVGDYSD